MTTHGHTTWTRGGPTAAQAATAAGLPHAEVPGDLQDLVEEVLEHEPDHPDPDVDWRYTPHPGGKSFSLGRFIRPHRGRLAAAAVLVALEAAAVQAGPVLTQIGVDRGIMARDRGVLAAAALAYTGLQLLAAMLSAARMSFTGRLGERLMEGLRVRVFGHMQRLDADFFTGERAGALLARMTSDIEVLSVLFHEGIVNFAVQALTLVVITALLVNYDPLLAAVTLAAAAPATLAASVWFRRRSSEDYRRSRNRISELLSNLQESLAGIRVIAAHNRREASIVRHRRAVMRHRDARVRASQAAALYAPGSEAIGIATQALLLGVGGAMATSGRITVGELVAYLLFLASFFAPVQALAQLYNSYQQAGAAIAKLRQLLETEPEVTERPGAAEMPAIAGEIELRDVTFGYQPDRPVLHGVNLRVAAGETLALIGPTGAGKTTLAQLVNRFRDPDSGTVKIDGHDVRCVTLHSLRSQIGVVPQEPFLFAGTVRDNIGFARPAAHGDAEPSKAAAALEQCMERTTSDAELSEALEAVGAAAMVDRLGGLDGTVHERGATLSAGERQLLALARVLVARPQVLVFDEATSNLDLKSEADIGRALDAVLEGRTAIVIAHRLDTARRADRIAVIEEGRIVESGSHDELVTLGGRYTAMLKAYGAQKKPGADQ